MQVVVFGAHDAPRERLALSYTSRRDHLGEGEAAQATMFIFTSALSYACGLRGRTGGSLRRGRPAGASC